VDKIEEKGEMSSIFLYKVSMQ